MTWGLSPYQVDAVHSVRSDAPPFPNLVPNSQLGLQIPPWPDAPLIGLIGKKRHSLLAVSHYRKTCLSGLGMRTEVTHYTVVEFPFTWVKNG